MWTRFQLWLVNFALFHGLRLQPSSKITLCSKCMLFITRRTGGKRISDSVQRHYHHWKNTSKINIQYIKDGVCVWFPIGIVYSNTFSSIKNNYLTEITLCRFSKIFQLSLFDSFKSKEVERVLLSSFIDEKNRGSERSWFVYDYITKK